MKNNDSALSFDAIIENSQFKLSIMEMERRIIGFTDNSTNQLSKLDKGFQNLSFAVAGYFSASALTGFVKQITQVRGEFQQLEIAFETMLESKEKADLLMSQVIELAGKTPFSLQEAANGAKQLLAFQVPAEQVIDTLRRMGDIASGLGVPIGRLNLVYGQVMAKGKLMGDDLRQFTEAGIPMVAELAKHFETTTDQIYDMVSAGKVGFKDIQDVLFAMTDQGGMFAGMMEKSSASLTGLVSQFEDALEVMYQNIGESQEGVLADTIKLATSSVENYEKILDILKILILTYGAYKTAVIATAAVQSIAAASTAGWTVAMTLQYRALLLAEGAQKLLNKTMLANPYVLAATLLVGLVVSLRTFSKEVDGAQKAQDSLNDAMRRSEDASASAISQSKILVDQINNESLSRKTRLEKLEEFIKLSPDHLQALTLENIKTNEGTKAIDNYIESLKRKIQLQELEAEMTASLQREIAADNMEESASVYDQLVNTLLNFNNEVGRQIDNAKDRVKANNAIKESEKQVQEAIKAKINTITESGDAASKAGEETNAAIVKNVQYYDDEIAALKKKQKEQSKSSAEYKAFQAQIIQLEKEREAITGKNADAQAKKDAAKTKQTFDEILEYKKSQYELYYKWISFLGKDAADKEFKDLLKNGKTYSEFLKTEIEKIQPKILSGTATKDERKQYTSLNIQYDDVTGAKSAMDLFKESISNAKTETKSLIDYLDKLKEIKNGLGESGLFGDEQIEARKFISTEQMETEKSIQKDMLEQYRTYEQQRADIAKDFDKQITYLRTIGEEDRAKLAEKEKDKMLSSLSVEELMDQDSWKMLFANLDELSVNQIRTLVSEIESNMDKLNGKFDPIDLIAIQDKLNQAKKILADENPFKAIGESIKIIFEESAKGAIASTDVIYTEWIKLGKNTEAVFAFVTDAVGSAEILRDAIGEVGATAISSLSSVVSVAISVKAALETTEKASKILAIVQAALVVVQSLANVFKSIFERHDKKLEKQINQHKAAVDRLELSYSNLDRAINKALGDDIYKKQQEAIRNLELQRAAVLKAQQAERDKKKTDDNKVREYAAHINNINNQIEDIKDQIANSIVQTDTKQFADELANAIVNAYSKGEDAALAFEEVSRKVMQNAVKNALKLQFIEKPIQKAVEQLQRDMGYMGSDGSFVFDGLTDAEQQKFKDSISNIGSGFGNILEMYSGLFKDLDSELKPEELVKSLEGSVKGITEETASILAGTFNAIRVGQIDALSIIKDQLFFLQEIAANTRYNKHLKYLESIDRKLDKDGSSGLYAKGLL